MNRFAFIGLHITGLCFGVTLVTGILLGITFFAWPSFTLVFCALGLAIIPDSLSGVTVEIRKPLGRGFRSIGSFSTYRDHPTVIGN